MPGGGGGSVTVTLNDFSGPYYFDGPCFPDSFDIQATLTGDTSQLARVAYHLNIRGAGGTDVEINDELSGSASRPGYYSRLVMLNSFLSEIEEDELTVQVTVRAVDSSSATLGQAERTVTYRRCSFTRVMTIRPDISTRDLYYGSSCSSSVTLTLNVSSVTPLPAGISMNSYWLADVGGREADVAAHLMSMRDITTPESIHIYEFTDTLVIDSGFISQVESALGPLDLSADPIFILIAKWEMHGRDSTQRLANDGEITIAVHPCGSRAMPTATPASAKDCPPGTYYSEITHQCIDIQLPTPGGSGGDNGGGDSGSASCSAPCVWSCMTSCSCVCP